VGRERGVVQVKMAFHILDNCSLPLPQIRPFQRGDGGGGERGGGRGDMDTLGPVPKMQTRRF